MHPLRRPAGAALVFPLLPLVLAAATPRFAHEGSDLPPDPAARFGLLDNGLRYVILPNAEPKGRVSLRLLILAGSLHEEEDQRGVAHFLEHMAFNGSRHFPPGTLVEFFQRMGMSFGGDTNASTGFDRTLYLLELPEASERTLAEGLKVFADYAGGLLLTPGEIDRERGIILSEKRARDTVGFRTAVAQYEFMLGGTLLPRRMPIGTAEVISSAPRERFTAFWDRWYRPERMAAIVVGDVDPALAERLVRQVLAPLQARGPAPAEPAPGTVASFPGLRVHFHPEPEAPATTVSLAVLGPAETAPDTAATRLARLPRQLAVSMLNRRLAVLAKREGAPFSSGRVSVSSSYRIFRDASIDLTCKPGDWAAALAVGEQELRRALEHGFRPGELAEARASFRNSLEQAVRGAATRRSSALAGEIAQGILDERVFLSPAASRDLYAPALERLTPEDCASALRAAFAGGGRHLLVSGNAVLPGDAAAALQAAHAASARVAVAPPPDEGELRWAYGSFGPPGTVAHRDHVADLDLTRVTFANGVRLNLKRTTFEAGIRIAARVGPGLLTEPAGQPGLALLANAVFTAGGLGRHSADELRRLLAGRNAGISFRVGQDALEFGNSGGGGGRGRGGRGGEGGGTTREDLLLTLQLLAAHLTDPGYRPEALRQARVSLEQMYTGFEHTPNGPLSREIPALLASGDPRLGAPPRDQALARTLEEVKAWLAPQLSRGAIEVALVGDLDPEAAIAAVAATLGALPPREPRAELAALRRVSFPAQPFSRGFTIDSSLPKGAVALFWPTTDASDIRRTRRLTLLAAVLSDRLRVRIREEMGGSYSPRAGSSPSEVFPGYGYLSTVIDIEPATAATIAEAVIALADDLARQGVTPEELERARLPLRTATRESVRTNAYWLTAVLARAQEKPEVLDWARSRSADLESVTAAELSELARRYLGRDRVSRATILPAVR